MKHYRSHPGAIVSMAVSADGEQLCTCGGERAAKVYDVAAFDMMGMLKLAFQPGPCAWVHARGDAVLKLAIADAGSGDVHIFDAREAAAAGGAGAATPAATLTGMHSSPVRCMALNARARCVVSADAKGIIEVWSPETLKPAGPDAVDFKFKADTDLYAHAKAKAPPMSLAVSPCGTQFATWGLDRRVRVFRFRTARLRCVVDESLDAAAEAQRGGAPAQRLEDIDFGRRMAQERELDREWARGDASAAPPPGLAFDESGNFLLYPTYLGVKVLNLVTARCARVLGRVENNERFLPIALAQGAPGRGAAARAPRPGTEAPGADPALACAAFRKHRVYFFTRREPADGEDAATGRDVFNERPQADDLAAAAALAGGSGGPLPRGATIHTSAGDIVLRLYADECPRTIENWTTHARNGYYDNLLFHRVIKGFMLQTGDPLGDGTGGLSVWGGEFEDEIRRDLRHDRPYTLSMANAGPNTNGSQCVPALSRPSARADASALFITPPQVLHHNSSGTCHFTAAIALRVLTCLCAQTPWLDGKHTVFGRVTKGADVVHAIEKSKTDRNDKPLVDIKMISITLDEV